MSAKNKLQNKKIRKADRLHDKATPTLHPHVKIDHEEKLAAKLSEASLERVLRCRRTHVVKAAGLSNALRRAATTGLASVFRAPLRAAYLHHSQCALIAHAELDKRATRCQTPFRNATTFRLRGYQNPNGN
jgi:hypothetical protein